MGRNAFKVDNHEGDISKQQGLASKKLQRGLDRINKAPRVQ